jgi:cell division protein FtsW (lipid II flippase)
MGRFGWLRTTDWWLVGSVLGLAAIGIAAIDVATAPRPGSGPVERQLVWSVIGLVAMVAIACTTYRVVDQLGYVAFALCIPLLLIVFWTGPVNGAQRWLRLGPVGIQPSELAKLAYVAAVARFLGRREDCNRVWIVIFPVILAAVPVLLILKQPDLGTSLLFLPLLAAMLLGARVRWRYLSMLGVMGLAVLPFLWRAMSPIQRTRITSFLDQRDTGPRPRDEGYQLYQSKLMVSLGGTTGSDEAMSLHLPFDHTDFIFSVVAGRWGLLGTSVTLGLFAVLLWRGLRIANRSVDPVGRLLALGIVTLLATQGVINMAMTVGLAPITGLTLPFVSYGGSSLLASFASVGILISISRVQADEWLLAR